MAQRGEKNCVCKIEDLSVAIAGDSPQTLVDKVSFEIDKGDYFALVGESGSGKSITCNAIMRLLPFKANITGKIIVDDQDVWGLSKNNLLKFRRHSVGMVFQDPVGALSPVSTIGAQMLETLRLYHPNAATAELEQMAIDALQEVNISAPQDRLKSYPHQLSGGLNQRVMIALALMGNPKLLIADEPTTALDMSVQAEVLTVIDELRNKNDLTVLLVTHDLGIVRDRATHIAVLKDGKMVESGAASIVASNPQAEYSKELFAAASVERPKKQITETSIKPVVLQFHAVNKTFFLSTKDRKNNEGISAAKDLSFSARKGQIVALIGESGSGKTTAAKMAMGLIANDSGQISVNSQAVEAAIPRRTAQMIFQHPKDSLDPLMRVDAQLHEVLSVHGIKDRGAREDRIANVCESVGLVDKRVLERRPTFLSGGEAQRVVIARALLLEPEILIADEPLSAVDVRIQKVILSCLKKLRNDLGITILLITHDLRVVFEIADQVVVMRNGEVIEDIPVYLFGDGKRHPYTQMLVDAVPGAKGLFERELQAK